MPNAMISGGTEISWKYNTNTATSDSAESIASAIAVREMTDNIIEEELTTLNDTADLKLLRGLKVKLRAPKCHNLRYWTLFESVR